MSRDLTAIVNSRAGFTGALPLREEDHRHEVESKVSVIGAPDAGRLPLPPCRVFVCICRLLWRRNSPTRHVFYPVESISSLRFVGFKRIRDLSVNSAVSPAMWVIGRVRSVNPVEPRSHSPVLPISHKTRHSRHEQGKPFSLRGKSTPCCVNFPPQDPTSTHKKPDNSPPRSTVSIRPRCPRTLATKT